VSTKVDYSCTCGLLFNWFHLTSQMKHDWEHDLPVAVSSRFVGLIDSRPCIDFICELGRLKAGVKEDSALSRIHGRCFAHSSCLANSIPSICLVSYFVEIFFDNAESGTILVYNPPHLPFLGIMKSYKSWKMIGKTRSLMV